MKKLRSLFITTVLIILTSQAAQSEENEGKNEAYLIQPGDVLEISVWKEEGLAREVLVRPDGGLSFPLVGDIHAAGNSIVDIQDAVSNRIAKYIPDPVVTVSMRQLSGNKVFVIGKVNRPGEIVANQYIDVMQALSVAGGMTPYANTGKIKVLRRENGILKSILFDYDDVEKGKNLEQNIVLKGGDVVVVP